MGTTSPRSHAPQRFDALERAHHVRRARAGLKRRIATGETSVSQVLLACPSHAATMSVGDLLMCQRWWGSARSRRLLVTIGVQESKSVGSLTERQRMAMAALLALRKAKRAAPVERSRLSRGDHG